MAENNEVRDDEQVPIGPPLKVMNYKTVAKRFGWWSAVVLLESWGRRQICLYLWQKVGDRWKRKQKFAVHNKEDWQKIMDSVNEMLSGLA
jgi:hypothetical protein